MYDKCQALSFRQSVQRGICDHAGQFCSTHFTYVTNIQRDALRGFSKIFMTTINR